MRISNDQIDHWTSRIKSVTETLAEQVYPVSLKQLNWKPRPEKWSIGQILSHLILLNSLYFTDFESIGSGKRTASLWERLSPFSGLIGRWLLKTMSPEAKPARTVVVFVPSSEPVDKAILNSFIQHQVALVSHLEQLREADGAQIISSPGNKLFTYSLADCVEMLVRHEEKHAQQILSLIKETAV